MVHRSKMGGCRDVPAQRQGEQPDAAVRLEIHLTNLISNDMIQEKKDLTRVE